MPNQGNVMKDYEIAGVLTYVRNSWGNAADKGKPARADRRRSCGPPAAKEGTRKTERLATREPRPNSLAIPVDYTDPGATPPKEDEKKEDEKNVSLAEHLCDYCSGPITGTGPVSGPRGPADRRRDYCCFGCLEPRRTAAARKDTSPDIQHGSSTASASAWDRPARRRPVDDLRPGAESPRRRTRRRPLG